jgi:UDP-3-O-[3-hydroxymyristoyl] N-acetylglucosamine deacetylase
MKQATLRDCVSIEGVGVHSGKPVRLVLHPAEAGSGYTFLRTKLSDGSQCLIDARYSSVTATALCTVVRGERDASVSTVEHVLAALSGLGIDNCLIEIDGDEMPIMDGSALAFVEAIDAVGVVAQSRSRKVVKVLRKVSVSFGDAHATLLPSASGFHLDVEIDFESPVIGRQRRVFDGGARAFRSDIASARTFGFLKDAEKLRAAGFALGASLDNTIVIDEAGVLNPAGLRFSDEFVRHKILDAVGDLSLAGAPLQGAYLAYCPGHKLNFMMLDALFGNRANYAIVEATEPRSGATRYEMASAAHAPDRS